MKKNIFYVAAMYHPSVLDYIEHSGITPDPIARVVPLCTSIEGAVLRFLLDVRDNANQINVKEDIHTIYVFCVVIPDDANVYSLMSTRPELQPYDFVGYPSAIPPDYVTGCMVADLTMDYAS